MVHYTSVTLSSFAVCSHLSILSVLFQDQQLDKHTCQLMFWLSRSCGCDPGIDSLPTSILLHRTYFLRQPFQCVTYPSVFLFLVGNTNVNHGQEFFIFNVYFSAVPGVLNEPGTEQEKVAIMEEVLNSPTF